MFHSSVTIHYLGRLSLIQLHPQIERLESLTSLLLSTPQHQINTLFQRHLTIRHQTHLKTRRNQSHLRLSRWQL